jgi:hypothetical protein
LTADNSRSTAGFGERIDTARTIALLVLRNGSEALHCVDDGLAVAVTEHVNELKARARDAAAIVAASWIAQVTRPVPPWLRLIHRDWIEQGLSDAPVATRVALAASSHDPSMVWLARWFCQRFPRMPDAIDDDANVNQPCDVMALAPRRFHDALLHVGASVVVAALGAATFAELSSATHEAAALRAACRRAADLPMITSLQRREMLRLLHVGRPATSVGLPSRQQLSQLGALQLAQLYRDDSHRLAQLRCRLPMTIWEYVAVLATAESLPWTIIAAAVGDTKMSV